MSEPRRLLPDPMYRTLVALVALVVLGTVVSIVALVHAVVAADVRAFAVAIVAVVVTSGVRRIADRYTTACERYLEGSD